MAIDYSAGSGRRGAYQNLARALQMKLEGENTRRAEDIRRQGLFGTGITQDTLSGLARTGLGIAQFGQDRMDKQRADATDSFNRRMERNQKLYERYTSSQDPNDQKRADMLLMNMNREQDRFEDAMRKYSKSGMMGTGFGSDIVDYDVDDSGFLQKMYNRANKKSEPPPLEVQNLSPAKKPGALQEIMETVEPRGDYDTQGGTPMPLGNIPQGKLPPQENDTGYSQGAFNRQQSGEIRKKLFHEGDPDWQGGTPMPLSSFQGDLPPQVEEETGFSMPRRRYRQQTWGVR